MTIKTGGLRERVQKKQKVAGKTGLGLREAQIVACGRARPRERVHSPRAWVGKEATVNSVPCEQ